jgi:hypothetical protein
VKPDGIGRELSDLRNQLEELRARIETLHEDLISDESSFIHRLKGRGFRIHRRSAQERLLISPDLSPALTTEFYEKMKKYSFRLFLRDLVRTRSSFRPHDLTQYCSSRIAAEYTRFLNKTGTVVARGADRYALSRQDISSFGPTLEWFVAEMFRREFASPAIFGVHFKDTETGGDYDVLALWEDRLVYAEVKSSPPKSIEDAEINAFFSRLDDLIPDVAFFFNDTHLRMKDKIIRIFTERMTELSEGMMSADSPERLSDEIYHVDHWIYVLNSKRDIVNNFSLGLRDHLRWSRGRRP